MKVIYVIDSSLTSCFYTVIQLLLIQTQHFLLHIKSTQLAKHCEAFIVKQSQKIQRVPIPLSRKRTLMNEWNFFSLSEQTHNEIVLSLGSTISIGTVISMRILQRTLSALSERVKFESGIILYRTACSTISAPLSNLQPRLVRSSAYEKSFSLQQEDALIIKDSAAASTVCFCTFIAVFMRRNGLHIAIEQMFEPVPGVNEINCLSNESQKDCRQSHKLRWMYQQLEALDCIKTSSFL